ncbi:hypothetical protein JL721_3294 [Aureococcus anophagefferens]|nr:hypothetical protein JL721_3294 [Aureococcus anophagefferens]
MDDLVAQCEAAGEAVKTAKAGGDKAAIKAAVDALVAIKTKITALDPSHPMALVDKAAKKKAEKEAKKQEAAAPAADGAPPSKNSQKAGEEGAKDAKKKAHKDGGAPPAAAAAPAAPAAAAPAAAPVAEGAYRPAGRRRAVAKVPADVETRVAALGAPAEAAWAPEADESTIQFVTRLFAAAIAAAVPEAGDVSPGVMRCGNAAFGDYQCNAPMGIFKTLKANGVARLPSPRAVGEAIAGRRARERRPQFGMLITHMEEAYPDFLQNPPNITDLTTFYKNAKKRFDEDEQFKEVSRKTVVALQAGDARCRAIWSVLCDISRKEFDKVYARLDVKVEEFGESYYNAMIPGAIGLLEDAGLVNAESGAACVFLPGHSFPLIIRKSDGGYGYDSTDMAAIHHRLRTLGVEWVVYVTDLGQAEHFHMCFEAARAAKWDDASAHVRLHHVGFGVVQGEDGKRFKTRSGETVRLVDLLDASVERMEKSLSDRVAEGKCALPPSEVKRAAAAIGYGAVKYFDLHQHPSTNYKFSYDKMLSTSGNTAVYLLFAHARLASIVAKARETRKVDAKAAAAGAALVLTQHGKERALAFELTQFAEVVLSVADDFLPVRICDYLYKIATKFTEFVTECKVLDDPRMAERLI